MIAEVSASWASRQDLGDLRRILVELLSVLRES
jgi:hypothetical protein